MREKLLYAAERFTNLSKALTELANGIDEPSPGLEPHMTRIAWHLSAIMTEMELYLNNEKVEDSAVKRLAYNLILLAEVLYVIAAKEEITSLDKDTLQNVARDVFVQIMHLVAAGMVNLDMESDTFKIETVPIEKPPARMQ